MAAVTPSTIREVSVGSSKAVIADFANTTDDADTWTSGINDIIFITATQEDTAGTATSQGVGASFVASTGVITFHVGEDNAAIRLLVMRGQAF